jgi:trigger factor
VTTSIVEAGPYERVVTLQIDDSVLESAKDKAAKRLSQDLKLKGFRPGKAPTRVVEATVGAERLRSEAIDLALPGLVGEALTEAGLSPATTPTIQELRDTENGVEVEVKVTLWPKLERPPLYEGRRISIETSEVTEEEIDEQVDRLRDQFAELEDVQRPVTEGDYPCNRRRLRRDQPLRLSARQADRRAHSHRPDLPGGIRKLCARPR